MELKITEKDVRKSIGLNVDKLVQKRVDNLLNNKLEKKIGNEIDAIIRTKTSKKLRKRVEDIIKEATKETIKGIIDWKLRDEIVKLIIESGVAKELIDSEVTKEKVQRILHRYVTQRANETLDMFKLHFVLETRENIENGYTEDGKKKATYTAKTMKRKS